MAISTPIWPRGLLLLAGDVALVVDGRGVIRDVALGSGELVGDGFDGWIDRPWVDTVSW